MAEKEDISDATLLDAVEEMDRGLIDANLGGNLYKANPAFWPREKRRREGYPRN